MALVPGSPGSYNPGGGGGAGTYPWLGFALFPLGAGMGMGVAKVGGAIARPVAGWAGRQFILKPLWKAQTGFRNPWVAYGTIDNTVAWMDRALLGAKIYDIVDGSSSQDLVQNGGPSAPLPLVQRGQLSDVLSLGKTLKTQSAHGRSSRTSATAGGRVSLKKPKQCPRGTRWRFGFDPSVGYPRFHCMKLWNS